jgi:hypothetical protein
MTTKAIAKKAAGQELAPKADGWEIDGLTPEQQAEAEGIKAVVKARPPRPFVTITYDAGGKLIATVGDPEKQGSAVLNSIRAYGAFGSGSNEFTDDMLSRIVGAVRLSGDAERDSQIVSGALALVAAVDPQNELEATMALQMLAANEAALMCFERSRAAKYMEHAAPYSNMANKAMRSFALHAEALAKIRRGGEQVVRHVHVNEGGQAVIAGTVNTGSKT